MDPTAFSLMDPARQRVCLEIASVLDRSAKTSAAHVTSVTPEQAPGSVDVVLRSLAHACTDSTCTSQSNRTILWTRHFGTALRSMRCVVVVCDGPIENVAIDESIWAKGNCVLVVSTRSDAVPCRADGIAHNDAMSVVMCTEGPVVTVANVLGDPLALKMAAVTMQAIWRVHSVRPISGRDEFATRENAAAVSAWVNEQERLCKISSPALIDCEQHLDDAVCAIRAVRSDMRTSMHDLTTRLRPHVGTFLGTPPNDDIVINRRSRSARTFRWNELSAEQQRAVSIGTQFVATGSVLRAEALNSGQISGLTKYGIDKMFGNFTSFRKTVDAVANDQDAPNGAHDPPTSVPLDSAQ